MVTAELAASLPVLVLLLAAAVSAVVLVGARVRVEDAAREAARAAARGDSAGGLRLAERVAPGAAVKISVDGDEVVATVRIREHPMASWLPAVTLSGRAVAALEPTAGSP